MSIPTPPRVHVQPAHATHGAPRVVGDPEPDWARPLSVEDTLAAAADGPGIAAAAAPTSAMASIRSRLAAVRQARFLDVRIPGWGEVPGSGPRMFARCRALTPAEIKQVSLIHANAPVEERGQRAAATYLAWATIGLWTEGPDGEPEEPEELWPSFTGERGAKLAELLGVTLDPAGDPAGDLVRIMFIDEATVSACSMELNAWAMRMNEVLRREAPKGSPRTPPPPLT